MVIIAILLQRILLKSMRKIAKGVNKINFITLYGNYRYIITENFPQKFSPCMYYAQYANWFFYVCVKINKEKVP